MLPRLVGAALATALGLLVTVSCSGGDSSDAQAQTDATPSATPAPTEAPVLAQAPTPTPTPDVVSTPTATPSALPTPSEIDPDNPAFTVRSQLTTVGLDEVFFGMDVEEASEAAGAVWEGAPEPPLPECYVIVPANGPEGVAFTVWKSTIERVDITTDLITTRSGAGVGSTVADLRSIFGEQLEQTGSAFAFVPADENDQQFRVVFETDGEVVTSVRSGRLPVVEPASPCT